VTSRRLPSGGGLKSRCRWQHLSVSGSRRDDWDLGHHLSTLGLVPQTEGTLRAQFVC
jgi:hypothetical protein